MTILDEPIKDENLFFELAPQSARIANLLIDTFVYYMLSLLIFTLPMFWGFRIEGYWMLILGPVYYFICEYYFNGKTVGKHFTKTRAIELNGEDLRLKSAATRTLIRAFVLTTVFFLLFYYYGNLHDNWSNTAVVKD
jgi:uncharacterized RDD family membrane protein YckC